MVSVANVIAQGGSLSMTFFILVRTPINQEVHASPAGSFLWPSSLGSFTISESIQRH